MKVRLVAESSGFGYSSKIATWVVESEENLAKLNQLRQGHIVEIPQKIANMIWNLVDVETGNIISTRHSIMLSDTEIKQRYLKPGFEVQSKARKALKEVSDTSEMVEYNNKIKSESSDLGTIKPLNEEIE